MFVVSRPSWTVVAAALAGYGVLISQSGAAEPVWNAWAGRGEVRLAAVAGVAAGSEVWFSLGKEHRRLASGAVRAGSGAELVLPVTLPEMKPGVALPLALTLRAGGEQGRLVRSGALWVFAERPIEAAQNPAAPRPLLLYDPEGKTAAALNEIEMAFEIVGRLQQLAPYTNAMIVVGEGVALESERGLAQALGEAVARGNDVLLLAPKSGLVPPPAAWGTLRAGGVQEVLRRGAIGHQRYQLDLGEGVARGKASDVLFQMVAHREEVAFQVSATAGSTAIGWDDPVSGGRFRACGVALIAGWKDTPAARWLLVEMLLVGKKSAQ